MKLTVQEFHTYNDLIKSGKEKDLELVGADPGDILIPSLDDNDEFYFDNLTSGDKIYPGINLIQKIKIAIDNIETS